MNKKAIIAMSGGVDSSVAALLIKNSSYEPMGVTLSLIDSQSQDIDDARKVCDRLGFSHTVLDLRAEFRKYVIGRFIDAYENLTTPNPCIICNRYIKFGILGDYARDLGCEFVATGHYAQITEENGRFLLKKGKDQSKDQSYVLYSLTQEQLSHTLFPLGALSKEEAREIAMENGFTNAHKKDSQDICFVANGKYAEFIEGYLGKTYEQGNFCDFDGNILGTHKGLIRYTIGQRKGLGLALPKPMYVCRLDKDSNSVILGDNADLFSDTLDAEDINLIALDRIDSSIRAEVKIRYSQKAQPATVYQVDDNRLRIVFDEPQRAITPGQSAVLYDGDTVIGGGIICKRDL